MSRPFSRTGLALTLSAVAIVVPCSAWFVAGSRAAQQEAAQIENAPIEHARLESGRLAEQLSQRLESLRRTESKRSLYDYLDPGHVLKAGCSYQAGLGSPLAQGPADPLIWTHFQIDEVGQLSLPTLIPSQATTDDDAAPSLQLAMVEELECAAPMAFQ